MTLVFLFSLLLTTVFCQTRTTWQYQRGAIIANPHPEAPGFDNTVQEDALTAAEIPPADSNGWKDCYSTNPERFCLSGTSLKVGELSSRINTCWTEFDFSYFQTFVDVPPLTVVTDFKVVFPANINDDAAIITIFNSAYPSGKKLTYVPYQSSSTVDLQSEVREGRNRLIITQVDSCASGNSISAIIQLNGEPLNPTCAPLAGQQFQCLESYWDGTDCSQRPKTIPTVCDDSSVCTTNDVCQPDGSCTGTAVPCEARTCFQSTCNPTQGCQYFTDASTIGQPCTDNNACTQVDTCTSSGSCEGSSPITCTASSQCHVAGQCDPANGVCSNPAADVGTHCSDGNACTLEDTCDGSGVCVPGAARACLALDQCHLPGVCDPASGSCSNPEKCDGKKCDDGNACTQLDTCKSGVCVGKREVICPVERDCQEPGTCEPSTGVCSPPDNKCDGSGCDDGNKCTLTDSCIDGECFGSNPRVCEALDQCHVAGECDAATGACSNPNKADGSPCDDGNACTQTDVCRGGMCVGTNPVVCTASDACHVAGVCDSASGVCSSPAKADGAACNDGNACTQKDTCVSGVCTGANPVVCKASDQCHDAGTCLPTTGKCSDPKKANGATCNDGDKCTQTDTCQEGKCVGSGILCCRTNGGRCGTCARDCRNSHHSILDLFRQWNRNGRQSGPDDVDSGSGGNCPSGSHCCVPRDQSTCRNDNNSCRIPDE